MKKNICRKLLAIVLTVAALASHAQQRPFYVDRGGRRVEAENITANEQGDLRVELGDGAISTIRRNDYRFAFVPKPDRVAALEELFNRGDYGRFLDNVQPVFSQYRYLGWGGRLYYWKGEAELSREQPEAALSSFSTAESFAISEEERESIKMGKTKALLELRRDQEASEILAELKTADSPRIAAFSFAAKGRMLARQQRADEAILEFLKAVLLFEPQGELREIREDAKQRLLALLEERGDPAYDRIRQLD